MSEHLENPLPPVQIPLSALSKEALTGIIEDFIQREGTDYGAQEISHETKIEQLERQLRKGEVLVTFDPNTESVSLMTKIQWKKMP